MPQTALEDILRTKFESLGGYIHLDCQYLGCSQSGNSVNVTVQHRGERVTIAATYLVGADGHHSTVRTSLSIPFDGDVYPYSFIVAEVTVVEWPFGLNAAQIYTSLDGLLICMPEPGKHRFRLIANVRDAPQLPSLELWRCIIARRAPGHACFEIANMHCSNRFRIHHRIARRYRAGRIFLAGDAAHVQSPATGQGMNLGIQDATILARIIGDAIYHGRNSEHDLDEYQRICQPRAQKVFGLTHRITLGMTLTNPVLCWVRNMVMMATNSLPMVRRKITRVISQLDL
ncbi:FAD/NAD(P)-binding domain-containing protein [Pseudovirgaria hyperparasitica]|uniref:FAD/NAD(P)-binding domain-containing protein n=1 Tax=Pseudovirgaria hyperparasitica TaxID=470096 RepID=A0A6A6WJE5_9PEZI|nr:FAD/NAD(P)-binding domain-containing protein [Pseudovirgaria hyperparasitica]KAF2762364.1 FAD/NAD(P)-binding domain-containing protein [Pseudovirgaria hyperparasitica]